MPKIKLSRDPESDLAKMSNRELIKVTRQRCKLCIRNTSVGKYLKELIKRIEQQEKSDSMSAAAPAMYAELSDLLNAIESGLFPQVAPGVDYPAVMEKKWKLRKLLKKARGEE